MSGEPVRTDAVPSSWMLTVADESSPALNQNPDATPRALVRSERGGVVGVVPMASRVSLNPIRLKVGPYVDSTPPRPRCGGEARSGRYRGHRRRVSSRTDSVAKAAIGAPGADRRRPSGC
jgi:hypothetical protein